MNDTQRLDAFESHGLFLTQHAYLENGVWFSQWVCHYGLDQKIEAGSLREVIDAAILQIQGEENAA